MDSIIQLVTDPAAYIAAHFYVSPFWYWCFVGACVCVGVTAAAYYFSVLRSLSGAIVFAVIAALFAYRRGETDAEAHQQKLDALKRKTPDPDQGWFR